MTEDHTEDDFDAEDSQEDADDLPAPQDLDPRQHEEPADPMPVVAIVGRPNVGKSSLLNALTGKRISIVQDVPGVTRDRVSTPYQIDGRWIELVDTGGYGFTDPDKLTEHIAHQIDLAMSRADLVLFVVDCQDGRTSADEEVAALLRRRSLKTVLIANKADGPKADVILGDFARLGLGTPVGVSAISGRNVELVQDAIRSNLDLSQAPTTIPEPQMLVAIVGKRNAGKSTLVNTVAKIYEGEGERVIVSEVPGTTRDSVDVRIDKDGKTIIVIDTAGVRKKRQMVTHDIEFYSFHRAQRSVRRADVVMMIIDGIEPISEPDKKLAQYIAEENKPVILVVNKWDLVQAFAQEDRRDAQGNVPDSAQLMLEFRTYIEQELPNVSYAPIAFITAQDGRNVQALMDLAQHLHKQANTRLSTSKLNEAVQRILAERLPSTPRGQRVKVYYATQTGVAPPTIVLFVNNPAYVNETYQRFMVNRFRELLPYDEVPIKLVVRGKGERFAAQSLDQGAAGAPTRARPARGARPAGPKHAKKPTKSTNSQQKPHPKSHKRKGPRRGTRPH